MANKNAVPKEFTISSGPIPRKGSPAGEGMPTPQDHSSERIPEFEYPPTKKSAKIGAQD
jgi:hypothetical protein